MPPFRSRPRSALSLGLVLALAGLALAPIAAPAAGPPPDSPVVRDGQHDFDFEIGRWQTRLSRLQKPLSGSSVWLDYAGTTDVRKILDGRANLVELKVEGPAGRIEALSLRLYGAESRQWSLHFSALGSGALGTPSVGSFRDGRGEFYSHEDFKGRMILVRFVITPLTPDTCRFEQAFSEDGGKTWEVNWIATDTRIPG
jgi:hypothetical protein